MYIACRRLEGAVGEVAVSSGAVAAAAVSVVAGPREWDGKLEAYAGRQAMIKTSRTRQSFPPLYESERWLNLCVDFRVSQCVLYVDMFSPVGPPSPRPIVAYHLPIPAQRLLYHTH